MNLSWIFLKSHDDCSLEWILLLNSLNDQWSNVRSVSEFSFEAISKSVQLFLFHSQFWCSTFDPTDGILQFPPYHLFCWKLIRFLPFTFIRLVFIIMLSFCITRRRKISFVNRSIWFNGCPYTYLLTKVRLIYSGGIVIIIMGNIIIYYICYIVLNWVFKLAKYDVR